jgi:hypothetical protein
MMMMLVMFGSGCDVFDVVNPGPVQDSDLDDRAAHPALVTGSVRALSDALNYVALTTAAISRELFPAGSTSNFGITPRQQQGILAYDDEHTGWLSHQRARAIAENGYERFASVVGPDAVLTYAPAGQIALWAGYANRLLGENWCEVTINGGPAVPASEALKRAESWFTKAAEIGTNRKDNALVHAALAGRASVRVGLGNWEGAVADAQQVPVDFIFSMKYNDLDRDQYNRIFWAGANEPYRAHTVWRTVYEEYYPATGDPRVAWVDKKMTGDAAVMDLGRVPFYQQSKHSERRSPIRLSSGREMRLIVAESLLRGGDWSGALDVINSLRKSVGVSEVQASNATEAWTRLKRERGIELWLEGRRMHDLRRWQQESTPGTLDPREVPGPESRLSPDRTLCYAIPKGERETNSNLPLKP